MRNPPRPSKALIAGALILPVLLVSASLALKAHAQAQLDAAIRDAAAIVAQAQADAANRIASNRAHPSSGVISVSATSSTMLTSVSGSYAVNVATSALPSFPPGSAYHQVVDVYYDRDGNKLDTKSRTHAVDATYCHPGVRQQEDLTAQDDGKGNVTFPQRQVAAAVIPLISEPVPAQVADAR